MRRSPKAIRKHKQRAGKTTGQKIAAKFEKARRKQSEDYGELMRQARNPFEYGMLTDEQLLAKVIDKHLEAK